MADPQSSARISEEHPPGFYPDICPTCKAKVIIHCSECEVQVTACVCSVRKSAVSDVGEEELRRLEEESRKDRLRQEGIWTP